ncbi:hypothetical protein ACP4OV_008252 [Aristida adscensionis]
MSSLIDIWTHERDRMVRTRGAQAFMSVASLAAGAQQQQQGRVARFESDGCGSTKPSGAATVIAAEAGNDERMQEAAAAAAAAGAPASEPVFVHEDAFLSVLVDCFGQ